MYTYVNTYVYQYIRVPKILFVFVTLCFAFIYTYVGIHIYMHMFICICTCLFIYGSTTQAEKNKENFFWYQAQGPGRMAQTPQAGTGDSACRSRQYPESVFNNVKSPGNPSMRGTFLIRLFSPPHNRELLPNPKETYDLNLSALTSSICPFCTSTAIVCTKNSFCFGHCLFCLEQERIQVVRSMKVARRSPTESNGTPAMDLRLC